MTNIKTNRKGFNIADYLEEPSFAEIQIEEKYISSKSSVADISSKGKSYKGKKKPCLENLSTGEITFIEKIPATIGIAHSCDVIIKDDDSEAYISRKHAVIDLVCGHYAIKDMSTNGSFFLNDDGRNPTLIKLSRDSFTELKNRQIIRLAKRNFRFILSGEER